MVIQRAEGMAMLEVSKISGSVCRKSAKISIKGMFAKVKPRKPLLRPAHRQMTLRTPKGMHFTGRRCRLRSLISDTLRRLAIATLRETT